MTPYPDSKCPSPAELTDLLTGYQVLELVAETRRSAIYRAQQVSLDRMVSIKVLPEEIGNDPALRHAFESDAKEMAKLKHPNLVDVFDFGIVDGMLFIITEEIPGRTLYETTYGNYVSEHEGLALIDDICKGLVTAHQAGIIHRNLNPNNILINDDGEAKIVDFGISSMNADEVDSRNSHYRSPEAISNDAEIGESSDIYALGVMLHELLTGSLPTVPYTPASSMQQVDPDLDRIIMKAIEANPSLRYSTVEQMEHDLALILKKSASPTTQPFVRAGPVSPQLGGSHLRASNLASANQSSNAGIAVVILVVVVLLVIVAIAVNSSNSSAPEKKPPINAPALAPISQQTTKPDLPAKPDPTDASPQEITPIPQPDKAIVGNVTPPVKPVQPEPPPKPSPPEFDVDAFLLKARTFMQGKEKKTLANYEKALLRNIDSFARDIKRAIQKLDRNLRKPVENLADVSLKQFRIEGRIPETITLTEDKLLKSLKPIHQSALVDQKKIDTQFANYFSKSRITYFQGIDHQIAILKKQKNKHAADMLNKEIKVTQNDLSRYIRILRGQDADLPPEEGSNETTKTKKDFKQKRALKIADKKKEGTCNSSLAIRPTRSIFPACQPKQNPPPLRVKFIRNTFPS